MRSLIVLALLVGCASSITPQQVAQDIDKLGAKETVRRLNAMGLPDDWENIPMDETLPPTGWDRVVENIASGQDEWLVLVEPLFEGTDAGSTLDLRLGLASALARNPYPVLRIIEHHRHLKVEGVCDLPFIEPTRTFARQYTREARRALEELHAPDVEATRLACLREIIDAQANVETWTTEQ